MLAKGTGCTQGLMKRFKKGINSMGRQGATEGCLKKSQCQKNPTRRKLQKVMEVNGDQHRGAVVAIHWVTPKGRWACPVRSFLLKGFYPLKYWSLTGVEAQVEISPLGSRPTLAGPSHAPYIYDFRGRRQQS